MDGRSGTSVFTETLTLDERDSNRQDTRIIMLSKVRCFVSSRFFKESKCFCRKIHGFKGFEDLKVVDLTRIVAGPYSTMLLGDLGAQVFKIESPGTGDECRNWPPYVNNDPNQITSYFAAVNRNKKSICVNLKTEGGRRVVRDLCSISDVLVENYVPGKLSKYGLGYEDLKEAAPHLIYCSITGFGQTGPYRNRPGYDVIAASIGGLLSITGYPDRPPCKPGVALTDIATGLYAHGAILAALLHRTTTGKGQHISCNLLSTQLSTLINIGSNYLNSEKDGERYGSAHESIVPYEAFKTSTGYVTVGAGSNAHFVALCKLLNIEHVAQDQRFTTNPLRVKNRHILIPLLSDIFQKKSTSEWMNILDGAPFPCGSVNKISETFEDKHVVSSEQVQELDLDSGGKVRVVGPAVKFSRLENRVRFAPPSLGQHGEEILSKVLNYPQDKIDSLLANGDVASKHPL